MIFARRLKPAGIIVVFTLVFVLFQNYLNRWIYDLSFKLYPVYRGIDPDNAFIYYYLHHIFQAIVFLALILAASKLFHLKFRDFGFNLRQYKASIKYALIFVAVWAVIQFVVGYLMVCSGTQFDMGFPVNARNVTGYFLFEVLFSGTSEELFFRGLIITVLLQIAQKYIRNERYIYILAILVSTVIFMAGHIAFELFPFQVTYINAIQQITVVIAGSFYGIIFLKTKSLLGPIIMHNLLNGVITICSLLFYTMAH